MDARTYRVKNMRQALELIRSELGADASLLHSRRVRRRGVAGWLTGQTELEVVASLGAEIPSRFDDSLHDFESQAESHSQSGSTAADNRFTVPSTPLDSFAPPTSSTPQASPIPIDTLGLGDSGNWDTAAPLARRLMACGFDRVDVETAIERATEFHHLSHAQAAWGPAAWLQVVLAYLSDLVPRRSGLNWEPGTSHWVALVGPTGVGKTTTVAKLAAEYALERRLSVGLVTVDTFRINGSDHLKHYAQMMNLPLEIVDSVESMERVAEDLTERCDLVLLDTSGLSPREHQQRERLEEILSVARPDEIHLVLSATTAPSGMAAIQRDFETLQPTGLILSKLDESPTLAEAWKTIAQLGLPLSYLTTGQRVPEDFSEATRDDLLEWLRRAVDLSATEPLGARGTQAAGVAAA